MHKSFTEWRASGVTGIECLDCCVTEKKNLNIEENVYKIVVRSAQRGSE